MPTEIRSISGKVRIELFVPNKKLELANKIQPYSKILKTRQIKITSAIVI